MKLSFVSQVIKLKGPESEGFMNLHWKLQKCMNRGQVRLYDVNGVNWKAKDNKFFRLKFPMLLKYRFNLIESFSTRGNSETENKQNLFERYI